MTVYQANLLDLYVMRILWLMENLEPEVLLLDFRPHRPGYRRLRHDFGRERFDRRVWLCWCV